MNVVVTAAPDPLVTLDLAKQHLRVESGDDDTLIEAFVAAASAHIDGPDGWLGRAIGAQDLEAYLPGFPCEPIALPGRVVSGISSVRYMDGAGVLQTVAAPTYELLSNGRLALAYAASWPSARLGHESVRIAYSAGYEETPPAIVAAVLLIVGDLYANRETVALGQVGEIPMSASVQALLSPFRVWAA